MEYLDQAQPKIVVLLTITIYDLSVTWPRQLIGLAPRIGGGCWGVNGLHLHLFGIAPPFKRFFHIWNFLTSVSEKKRDTQNVTSTRKSGKAITLEKNVLYQWDWE